MVEQTFGEIYGDSLRSGFEASANVFFTLKPESAHASISGWMGTNLIDEVLDENVFWVARDRSIQGVE